MPAATSSSSSSSSGGDRDSTLKETIKQEHELLRQALRALSDSTTPQRRQEANVQQLATDVERTKQRKDRIQREREEHGAAVNSNGPSQASSSNGNGAARQRSASPPPKRSRSFSPPPPPSNPPPPQSTPFNQPNPPFQRFPRAPVPTVFPRPNSGPPAPSFAPRPNWDRGSGGGRWADWWAEGGGWDEEQNVALAVSGFEVGATEDELKKAAEEVLRPHMTEGVTPLFKSLHPDTGRVVIKVGLTDARQILMEESSHKVVLLPSNVPTVLNSLRDTVSVRIWRLPKTATVAALRGFLEEFGTITDVWLQDVADATDWPYLFGRIAFDSPSACRRVALEYHNVKHFPGGRSSLIIALPKEVFGIGSAVLVTFPRGLKVHQLRDAMSSAGKIIALEVMDDEADPTREKAVVVYKGPDYAKDATTKSMPAVLTITRPQVDKDLL